MKRDQVSSLVWFTLAIFICIETILKFPLGSWNDPGPGVWPLGAGILLGLLSVLNYVLSVLDKSPETEEAWYPERWKALVLVLGVTFAYALSLETMGFLIGMFFLLIFLFRAVPEPQRWIVTIGGGALFSLTAYAIFELWLKSNLPKGIWGF